MTLEIKGFWYEDDASVKDLDFANALAEGLVRFVKFVRAKRVAVSAVKSVPLKAEVQRANDAAGWPQ